LVAALLGAGFFIFAITCALFLKHYGQDCLLL
jgi:hypothetical protein